MIYGAAVRATYLIATQIGLQLASKDLESRTLANTVGTDKPKYLAGAGSGETVKFECVGGVTMSNLRVQIRGQINDSNGFKRASDDNKASAPMHIALGRSSERVAHFLTQIPHPIHKNSEMKAILSEGFTSIQSFPTQSN